MMFSMIVVLKCRANIWLFRQTSKRLVSPRKRRNRRIRSFLFFFFTMSQTALSSFADLTSGARLAALADAGVALPFGADCIFLNPAALYNPAQKYDVHLFYTNPFGLDDVHLGNCAVRFSKSRCAGALGVQNFGNSIYAENQFLMAVAYRVLPTVSFGVACRYGSLSIQHYGQAHAILCDAGATARLSPKMYWGFSIKNATNAKIGVNREPLPTVLTSGLCLKPRSNLSLLLDVSKDTRFPLDVRCGVDYHVYAPLALRVGVGSEPTRYCAGFSILFSRFRIDYAFSSHFDLGFTHMFSVGIF
jgi:hypothetical protein